VNGMSEKTIAIFDTPTEAVAALRELQREGVPRSSITVMSSEPLHLEGNEAPRSRIGGFAIVGGFSGAAFAILLTVWTSRKVGLVTGGMPIFTPWAFGIIVFELAALGAILATLGRMIAEAQLARHNALTDYDEAVADGRIVVSVHCSDDFPREIAEKVLGPTQL
jgi:ActD protein